MESVLGFRLSTVTSRKVGHMEKAFLDHKVKFTDNYWNDYFFYLRNNHVVLSIFMNHHDNPFSGIPRLLGFICSIAFSMLCALSLELDTIANFKKEIIQYTLIVFLEAVFDLEVQQLSSCA